MHQVKITIDCTKDGDEKWGSTTIHEARELSYEQLVAFQRELWDGLGQILLGYGESKVAAGATPAPTVTTTTYAR